MLAVLAVSCQCELYECVRQALNGVIDDPGITRAPPIEEWGGMKDLCDVVFCRCSSPCVYLGTNDM